MYTLWQLLGDHPIAAIIFIAFFLDGIANIISAAKNNKKDEDEEGE